MGRDGESIGRRIGVALVVAFTAVLLVLPVGRFSGFYPAVVGEFLARLNWGATAAWQDTLLRRARTEASPNVSIISLDDHTLRAFGKSVLPREYHARLIRNLKAAGARVIAFDFLFDEPRSGDIELAAAMREHGRVILAWAREESTNPNATEAYPILPHESLAKSAHAIANVNLPNDQDGLIRRFPWSASLPDPDDITRTRDLPSFAVAASEAIRHEPRPSESPTPISYRAPAGFSCRRIPYYQAFWADDPSRAGIDMAQLRRWVDGRIVVVGVVTESAHDTHSTPWGKMPGVEIQANAIDTILVGRFMAPVAASTQLLMLAGGSLMLALVPVVLPRLFLVIPVGLVLICLPLATSATLYRTVQLWLPPVEATAGMLLAFVGQNTYLYWTQRRRVKSLRRHFGRFVGPRVLSEIMREGYVELQGERREITILFSDLQGFTTLSERLPPAQTVALLNQYLNRMVSVIFAHEGTLDKFMGDGIMAYFGAPQPSADHAAQAVRCAVEMQRALAQWREETVSQGLPPVIMRIGVHTGLAVVGEMGSKLQVSYTAIGDAVNVAARLEPLNKQFGTGILISERTLEGLGGEFTSEFKGELQVKGRDEPVRVYTLHVDAPVEALAADRELGARS